jgi:hypothetical protein
MRFNILEKNKYCTGVQTLAFEAARYGTQQIKNYLLCRTILKPNPVLTSSNCIKFLQGFFTIIYLKEFVFTVACRVAVYLPLFA